jgi:hypothetical protein
MCRARPRSYGMPLRRALEPLAARAGPSPLSLERHWFRRALNGQEISWLYRREDDRDAAFNDAVADPEAVAAAWTVWRDEVEFSEGFVDTAPDLEVKGTSADGKAVTLREVLVHMIEEYARHTGHADLLRERIDGRVGQ